jgi:hypothetical protein
MRTSKRHVANVPIVAQLVIEHRWRVRMSGDPDPVFSFECLGVRAKPKRVDAWIVRERFFAIKTPDDALEFFKEFGPWSLDETPYEGMKFSTSAPTLKESE